MTGLILAAAIAAPPQAPKPPLAPPVEQKPMCICGDACKCPTGDCPGKCPVKAPAPREKGLPAGYPAAPDGYEWRRDDRGPDGWGLFQVAPTASVTSPQRAAPVTQYGWRQVCTGNGCRLVYGPLP